MARPRMEVTTDPLVKQDAQAYADLHTNGNLSAAVEHLIKKGLEQERQDTRRSMAYASTAATYILLILAAFF